MSLYEVKKKEHSLYNSRRKIILVCFGRGQSATERLQKSEKNRQLTTASVLEANTCGENALRIM